MRAPSSQFYIFDGEPRDNPDALKSVIESKVGVFGAEILGSQARSSKQNAPSTPSTHLLLYGAKDSIARAEHTRVRTHILLDIKRELIGIKMSICIGIWEWSLPPHNLIECRTLNFATTATTTTTELLARPTSEHTHTISSLVRRQRRRSAHTHTHSSSLAGKSINPAGLTGIEWDALNTDRVPNLWYLVCHRAFASAIVLFIHTLTTYIHVCSSRIVAKQSRRRIYTHILWCDAADCISFGYYNLSLLLRQDNTARVFHSFIINSSNGWFESIKHMMNSLHKLNYELFIFFVIFLFYILKLQQNISLII